MTSKASPASKASTLLVRLVQLVALAKLERLALLLTLALLVRLALLVAPRWTLTQQEAAFFSHSCNDALFNLRCDRNGPRCPEERGLPWFLPGQRCHDGQDIPLWSHPVHGF